MDVHRKRAYRYLLYRALLDIRPLAWLRVRTIRILNPFHWISEIRRIRRAGAIADWLHNLAMFSYLDFERFDEAWFWRDLENLNRRHPEFGLGSYKEEWERRTVTLAEGEGRKQEFPGAGQADTN